MELFVYFALFAADVAVIAILTVELIESNAVNRRLREENEWLAGLVRWANDTMHRDS